MGYQARGDKARNPTTYNVSMTLANTEYSQQLSQNTRGFDIHTRDETIFRMAFEPGHVAGSVAPFFTIVAGTRYWKEDIDVYVVDIDWDGTIYFASPNAGKVVEIIEWV